MSKFKAGDLVYYPTESNRVLTICESYNPKYPIKVGGQIFTCDGKFVGDDAVPSIFPATPEKHTSLEQLHGIEFEAPHKPKTPKDVIQAMLDSDWDTVPVIYLEDGKKCLGYANKTYLSMSAKPFNPKTSKIIIDYVNGQEIYAD